tara:strand:+ start:340 stop:786 length:447 start_codon:yes stop_codon:yes gene_type:complete
MANRIRLVIGICVILASLFWNKLENVVPVLPDNNITIEKPEESMIEGWDSVADSITDPQDRLKLCIFNKSFAERVEKYDASAQQINDVYVQAAKNLFESRLRGKYELLGPATKSAMVSILGDEDHQATEKEKSELSEKFMAFAWCLNN